MPASAVAHVPSEVDLEVDGGITDQTIAGAATAGA